MGAFCLVTVFKSNAENGYATLDIQNAYRKDASMNRVRTIV